MNIIETMSLKIFKNAEGKDNVEIGRGYVAFHPKGGEIVFSLVDDPDDIISEKIKTTNIKDRGNFVAALVKKLVGDNVSYILLAGKKTEVLYGKKNETITKYMIEIDDGVGVYVTEPTVTISFGNQKIEVETARIAKSYHVAPADGIYCKDVEINSILNKSALDIKDLEFGIVEALANFRKGTPQVRSKVGPDYILVATMYKHSKRSVISRHNKGYKLRENERLLKL